MILIAHIFGVPVEELLLPWASSTGLAMLTLLAASIRRKGSKSHGS